MHIKIKILNIGDADAIIVFLKDETRNLLFLIDGGKTSDSDKVIDALEESLKEADKKAPDFILCTHYDADHIGGLDAVVRKYKKGIGKVWMHMTSEQFDFDGDSLGDEDEYNRILPSEADDYLGGAMSEHAPGIEIAIKTLQQERDLIALVKSMEIPIEEPITEQFYFQDWPELSLIGPTEHYYRKLFPKHFTRGEFIKEMMVEAENTESIVKTDLTVDPDKALDDIPKSKITKVNLNSALLMVRISDRKFLFAGDAGIESFEAIPDATNILSNLHWLKVPHHGSRNNITSTLINLMSPKIAMISGKRYLSDEVVACLTNVGAKVSCTSRDGDLVYEEETN